MGEAAASLLGAVCGLGSQVGALTRALQMEVKMGRRKKRDYKRNPVARPMGNVKGSTEVSLPRTVGTGSDKPAKRVGYETTSPPPLGAKPMPSEPSLSSRMGILEDVDNAFRERFSAIERALDALIERVG